MESTTQNKKQLESHITLSKVGDKLHDYNLFWPISTPINRVRGSSCTYLVDEELQLDDGGSALMLAVALNTGPSKPESVASQGRDKLWTVRFQRLQMDKFVRRHLQRYSNTVTVIRFSCGRPFALHGVKRTMIDPAATLQSNNKHSANEHLHSTRGPLVLTLTDFTAFQGPTVIASSWSDRRKYEWKHILLRKASSVLCCLTK